MGKPQSFRRTIYELIEKHPEQGTRSRLVQASILALICVNVVAVILESEHSIARRSGHWLHWFDTASLLIFTVEYLLRLWSCVESETYQHPVQGRVKFALTPFAVVDLLAVAPFYLPMILPMDLRVVRTLRLLRVFRIFKIGRYSEAMQTMVKVLKSRREELVISLIVVLLLLVVSSTAIYLAERDVQPERFGSIPSAMWWSVVTLTTVGYGDVYPVTPAGRILEAIISLLGIGLFALPTAILGAGFVEEIAVHRSERRVCPHCGKELGAPKEIS